MTENARRRKGKEEKNNKKLTLPSFDKNLKKTIGHDVEICRLARRVRGLG